MHNRLMFTVRPAQGFTYRGMDSIYACDSYNSMMNGSHSQSTAVLRHPHICTSFAVVTSRKSLML